MRSVCKSKSRFCIIVLLLSSLVLSCPKVDVNTPDDITIDWKHIGMIAGRVLISKVDGNQVVYVPYDFNLNRMDTEAGAYVWIPELAGQLSFTKSKFETETTPDGVYSIDSIPAGTYVVKAATSKYDRGYDPRASTSVTVIKQQTTNVPDLRMMGRPVIKGRVFQNDKTTPFASKAVSLYSGLRFMFSTTTSSDGSFAFYRDKDGWVQVTRFTLKCSEGAIYFFESNSEVSYHTPGDYNIEEKDAYLAQ